MKPKEFARWEHTISVGDCNLLYCKTWPLLNTLWPCNNIYHGEGAIQILLTWKTNNLNVLFNESLQTTTLLATIQGWCS